MNIFITSLLKIINNPDIRNIDYTIAYYLLENYDQIPSMTVQEISEACFVSVSTLNRFFKTFGFKKYVLIKKLMVAHKSIRLDQLKERVNNKNSDQVELFLKTVLNQEDYEIITSNEVVKNCCDMIEKCDRIMLIGSNEIMDSLLRFQCDLTVMNKLVIQNSIYDNNYIEPKVNDLVFFFSMTGRIFELQFPKINESISKNKRLIYLGYHNYYAMNSLYLKVPNYLDEAVENMIVDHYFQKITYTYYKDYYDIN